MSDIFPLLLGLFGYSTGVGINFLIERLYISRKFYTEAEFNLKGKGWINFLVWPWRIEGLNLSKKIRIVLIELIFSIIPLWLWYFPPQKVEFFWGFPLLIYFSIVLVIDLEYKLIFTQISFVGAMIGLGLGFYLHGIYQTIFGGLIGFGLMFMMYKLGELYIKRLSRQRGEEVDEVALGFGDVYLGGIIGLLLGWPGVIIGLFLGVLAGGICSFFIIVYKKIIGQYESTQAIPYAPFLIFGVILIFYFRTWLN